MDWLNYHHLYYFWVVTREGSISRASEQLRLSQPTVSAQIKALEDNLGEKLFERLGRGLKLTETGVVVLRYAQEIFTLGQELQDVLKGRPAGRPSRLVIGIADVLPKMIAHRLIQPALQLEQESSIVCREDRPERLIAELAVNGVDVVLSDAPLSPSSKVKAFNHLLGECNIVFLATSKLAARYKKDFPQSMDGAPFLAPSEDTALRRSLDRWFDKLQVRPKIVGEFDDTALIKIFAQEGRGIFACPSAIAAEVKELYTLVTIGKTAEVKAQFYAISIEKRLKHPAVRAISEGARENLFNRNSGS